MTDNQEFIIALLGVTFTGVTSVANFIKASRIERDAAKTATKLAQVHDAVNGAAAAREIASHHAGYIEGREADQNRKESSE